jgi:predicted nuclease of predicted toxin-antitoxin system
MKFIVDMNLSPSWCEYLIAAGFEATHWSTLGEPDSPDSELVAMAVSKGATLLTHDLDFGAILVRSGATKPSVVQLRGQNLDPAQVSKDVCQAIKLSRVALENGALVTVDLKRKTLRVLELGSR